MKPRHRRTVAALAFAVLLAACGKGDGGWDKLYGDGTAALGAKDYATAEAKLKAAIDAAQPFGASDQRLVNSYYALGLVYEGQKQLDKAEALYRTLLDLREKALGPDDPLLVTSIKRLAQVLEDEGKQAEAAPLRERIKALQAKGGGGTP